MKVQGDNRLYTEGIIFHKMSVCQAQQNVEHIMHNAAFVKGNSATQYFGAADKMYLSKPMLVCI